MSEMEVLLANPRGFCAGVERAIRIVERAIELHGAPIYVRHEIVHNRSVVERLEGLGAVFIEELNEAPDDSCVIFSAHGVPKSVPAEASRRKLFYLDATCPLVTKVHREAEIHHKRGREIILIGHAGHPEVIGTLGQLRALGIQLSIDDFGTGYSSLSYLKRFPVMSLKIDKSFVSELDEDDDHDASAIVRAIISIAHSLEIKVIAEGVETEHQMSFLLANGCDSMQGFLFSKPLTGSEFIALLERESAGSGPSSLLRQLQLSFFDKPTAAVEITDS